MSSAPLPEQPWEFLPSATPGQSLVARLAARTATKAEYWSFAGNAKRSHGHALFSYPAMMVPQLQGSLLDDLIAADPSVQTLYDPFGGSGTVLTECMLRGLDFIGSDINPLAVLIMSVKARPLSTRTLRASKTSVLNDALGGGGKTVDFPGLNKWFSAEAISGLSALRQGISALPGRDARRFMWVCLAETVRLTSNSRTSTFKLHTYSPEMLKRRSPRPLEVFERVANANIAQLREQWDDLWGQNLLRRGRYTGSTTVLPANVLDPLHWPEGLLADGLMTSPPYGDNRTTVPYGQHAYLPLMWINRADIPSGGILEDLVGSPYRTDVASLGGRRRRDRDDVARDLSQRSDQIASTSRSLAGCNGDGLDRFVSFCSDLDAAIKAIGQRLRPGAIQFWTLGDRRISGLHIPTSQIVAELSADYGSRELTTITRNIPPNAKRMALRNNTVPTMTTEEILVLQTCGVPSVLARAQPHARRVPAS